MTLASIQNICAYIKYLRIYKISAPHQECSRLIIYDSNKAAVEILKSSRPIKDVCAHKCRRPNSYYLGSAESPTSDSFSVRLKSSLSDGVASPPCSPQVGSGYGRRLCCTVLACCTGTTCLNIRALSNVRGREYFHLVSGKNQKPNSAHKCPITSIQIRT